MSTAVSASVTQELQRATPESQGIASAAILRFVEAVEHQIHELHSFMLLRHGMVIAEGGWSPYQRETPHLLFSLIKSFTSTAVGLAVTEGRFSIDDLVVSHFPDEAPAEPDDHVAALRVRDLLTMSSGHAADPMFQMTSRPDGDWIAGFFEAPFIHLPGTQFVYNSGATYLLNAIIQKTSGLKLVDYLDARLFAPLGIDKPTWNESPQGITTGGSLKTEDLARFGQLYLQKGVWNGEQVLPEAWIDAATSVQIANGEPADNDHTQGYGYQFWRCRHGAYRAAGAFGQYCIVMPQQDAVLAITAGIEDTAQPMTLAWELLLPAIGADALPDDALAYELLTQKLSGLNLPPVDGKASSPLADHISDRFYHAQANALKIETLTLNFSELGCTLRFKTKAREEIIACGYGDWQQGQTALFDGWWASSPSRIAASGAWTADDTFTAVVRMIETPFVETLTFRFVGDEADQAHIETTANVGFGASKTRNLTAQA